MKTCRKCHVTKPLADFHRTAISADGRHHTCKMCRKAYAHAYYVANRAKIIARVSAAYWADPEPKKAYVREYQKTHVVGAVRDAKNAKNRERYHANPVYEKERSRRYQQANPDKWRQYTAVRRARIGDGTQATSEHIKELMGESCAYCGSCKNIEVDHVIPVARGGTHTPDNLVAACRRCNRSKGAKMLSEWSGPPETNKAGGS